MKQRLPNFVIARLDSGNGNQKERKLGGATPTGKKLLSRYFSPNVKPIISQKAIPDAARACILLPIMHGSRAGARAAAQAHLVDPDSVGHFAQWMVKMFMRKGSCAESPEARVLLKGAIGIAREFGFEDLRKHAAVRLCNRLVMESEPAEAAKIAQEELPDGLRRALIERWRSLPNAPIIVEPEGKYP